MKVEILKPRDNYIIVEVAYSTEQWHKIKRRLEKYRLHTNITDFKGYRMKKLLLTQALAFELNENEQLVHYKLEKAPRYKDWRGSPACDFVDVMGI